MEYNKNVVQVVPINDIYEHDETYTMQMGFMPISACPCQPKSNLDPESGGWIIIHSSWDGREAIEEFNAIINKKHKND